MTAVKDFEAAPEEEEPKTTAVSSDDAGLEEPPAANKEEEKKNCCQKHLKVVMDVYVQNSFVVNVALALGLAFLAPGVGLGLAPAWTASRFAVGIIFLLTGLGSKSTELVAALANVKFNATVQTFNLGLMPVAAWLLASALKAMNVLDADLANGVIACGALPTTVNMCIVLTKSAGGSEAAAVFNSAFGNLLGVFLTPLWILAFLGGSASVSFADVILKIAQRVLLPLFIGQLARHWLPSVANYVKTHKKALKKVQESLLVFIVYCAFCSIARERYRKNGSARQGPSKIIAMILVQGLFLLAAMAAAWLLLGFLFPLEPELRVMGLFGCTHKTVALGIPLIFAIFEDSSKSQVGIYLLPLLVYHPAQLFVGSALAATLFEWTTNQRKTIDKLKQKDLEDPKNIERYSEDTKMEEEREMVASPTGCGGTSS